MFVPPHEELPAALVCSQWRDILLWRRGKQGRDQWQTWKRIALASETMLKWAKSLGCGRVFVRQWTEIEGVALIGPRGLRVHGRHLWVACLGVRHLNAFDIDTGKRVHKVNLPFDVETLSYVAISLKRQEVCFGVSDTDDLVTKRRLFFFEILTFNHFKTTRYT